DLPAGTVLDGENRAVLGPIALLMLDDFPPQLHGADDVADGREQAFDVLLRLGRVDARLGASWIAVHGDPRVPFVRHGRAYEGVDVLICSVIGPKVFEGPCAPGNDFP